jgi:capping protein (actin filament) muscle Z-line, beta
MKSKCACHWFAHVRIVANGEQSQIRFLRIATKGRRTAQQYPIHPPAMDHSYQKEAEALLQCVPPQNLRNALTLLMSSSHDTDGDETAGAPLGAAVPPHKCYVPFDRVEPGDGKPFLASAYNRKQHQHRSPWDNAFYPKEDGGGEASVTSSFLIDGDDEEARRLRNLEITFNEVWTAYTALYYGHEAIGSVYLKPLANHGSSFEGLFGIQKEVCPPAGSSSWNSASRVIVKELSDNNGGAFSYHVETMVHCILEQELDTVSDCSSIGALVSKTCQRTVAALPNKAHVTVGHIETTGAMIEANEIDLRSSLEKVLIPKNQQAMEYLLAKKQIGHHSDINPIMDMIMNSDLLKRRLAKQQQQQQPPPST